MKKGDFGMKKVCVFFADGFEEVEGLTVVDMGTAFDFSAELVSLLVSREKAEELKRK